MAPVTIRRRVFDFDAGAWPTHLHPRLARVLAARGVAPDAPPQPRLADLVAPNALEGIDRASAIVVDAIDSGRRICIAGDFDADGATATAVALRGLAMLGARSLSYCVPNRQRHGYGFSVGLVETLLDDAPDLVITVDNGISSHAGIALARRHGMRVVVTDHHLPGDSLPAADAIVNPLLTPLRAADSGARLAHLAGVGVVFYLLLAVRAELRRRGRFEGAREPDLAVLLDLVALGTVADLVGLDVNNRALVAAGLRRIRSGRCAAGVLALCRVAGRDPARLVASDLAFALAPRVNAAGRLEDMRIGIECLLADDAARADALAAELDRINAERQALQADMIAAAETAVAAILAERGDGAPPHGVVLHRPDWHAGVVGLVASRLKEHLNRPVVAFAPVEPGSSELRGSARSIAGFHLRDALAEIDARHPGLIDRFGGHAMAAGLGLDATRLDAFAQAFDEVARARLDADALEHVVWTDGALDATDFDLAFARTLREAGPWGQAFPEPLFDNAFETLSWCIVGEKHVRLSLRADGGRDALDAIAFGAAASCPVPTRVRAVFQLDVDVWDGRERLRLVVRHLAPDG